MSHSVLLVDDNKLVRRMLRSWLETHAEWNICGEAENGKLAVEQVSELHPDIVILDLQMPVMNGLEAAREIKRLAPNTALIIFTAHASYQLVKEARAHGIDHVISKSDMLGGSLLSALRQASSTALSS